jgi:hypothetical protein
MSSNGPQAKNLRTRRGWPRRLRPAATADIAARFAATAVPSRYETSMPVTAIIETRGETLGAAAGSIESTVPTRYWHRLDDGRVQCDLCPRFCKLHEGQRGYCFVRACEGGQVVLTTYGRSRSNPGTWGPRRLPVTLAKMA